MSDPSTGITILVILTVVILGQLFFQGFEHRRRHRELKEQLDRLEAWLKP